MHHITPLYLYFPAETCIWKLTFRSKGKKITVSEFPVPSDILVIFGMPGITRRIVESRMQNYYLNFDNC